MLVKQMVMIMNFKKIIFAVLLSGFCIYANAQENKGFYLQGNLGYAMGVAPGGNFSKNTLGDAGVYGGAIGYRFDEHLRVDFGVDYRDGYSNQYSVDETVLIGSKEIDYTDTQLTVVRSLSTMFSFYYDIAEINKITPYVMLGAGVARNTANSHSTFKTLDNKPNTSLSFSDGTHINFAWKMGAGAAYSINKNFNIDLHYQFVDLGKFRTGNIETTHGINRDIKKVGPNLEGKLQSHEILCGLVYKF